MATGEIDREEYKRSLLNQANSFNWAKTTQEVLKLYEAVLAMPSYQMAATKQYVFAHAPSPERIEQPEQYSPRKARGFHWLRKARSAYHERKYAALLIYGAAGIVIAPEFLRNEKVKNRIKRLFRRS